ncbi:18388_t:CDS:2, partial [Acaulospora morrowiae]
SRATNPHSRSADEEAFLECIEAIEANLEDVNIIKKASDKEKKWWINGNYKAIDEERLPLGLMENVTYREYEKKVKLQTQPSPIYNFKNAGATTCLGSGRRSARQADTSSVPNRLPIPSPHPSDVQGNPWPTVVCEVPDPEEGYEWMSIASLNSSVMFPSSGSSTGKVPANSNGRNHADQPILFNPQNRSTNLGPLIDIKVHIRNGCSAQGILTETIAPECVYQGCTPPYPPYPFAGN